MSESESKGAKRQAYLARLKGENAPSATPAPRPENTSPANKGPVVDKSDFENMTVQGSGDKIAGFSGRIGTDTVKRIGEVVDEHPDKALAIFRAWMNQ